MEFPWHSHQNRYLIYVHKYMQTIKCLGKFYYCWGSKKLVPLFFVLFLCFSHFIDDIIHYHLLLSQTHKYAHGIKVY